MTYLWLKNLHIVSATILFGTGLGIAFFQFRAVRRGEVRVIAAVSAEVVRADAWFTTPAVLVQLATGLWMTHLAGLPLTLPWLAGSLAGYALAGACWLPVVWIQLRLRDLAAAADAAGEPLPERFHRLFRIWLALGWPAFLAVLVVIHLMVFKGA